MFYVTQCVAVIQWRLPKQKRSWARCTEERECNAQGEALRWVKQLTYKYCTIHVNPLHLLLLIWILVKLIQNLDTLYKAALFCSLNCCVVTYLLASIIGLEQVMKNLQTEYKSLQDENRYGIMITPGISLIHLPPLTSGIMRTELQYLRIKLKMLFARTALPNKNLMKLQQW